MIPMVSAWASEHRIVLGQRKVNDKSNEITAIPELLRVLDLNGAVVIMDAMGCQTEIAAQIVEQHGDYVLALKGNPGNLHEDVEQLFEYARKQNFHNIEHAFYQTQEQGHGRQEVRKYWVMGETTGLIGAENWSKLSAIGCVEAQRQIQGKITTEFRYYLLSLPLGAEGFADAVRGHWSIENQLHWILDVGFHEDQSRTTQGHSAENLAVVRHLAVSLLSQDQSTKGGTHAKRLKAAGNDRYLIQLLSQSTPPRKSKPKV
jgi:predicted transposase YbfD/YdcC